MRMDGLASASPFSFARADARARSLERLSLDAAKSCRTAVAHAGTIINGVSDLHTSTRQWPRNFHCIRYIQNGFAGDAITTALKIRCSAATGPAEHSTRSNCSATTGTQWATGESRFLKKRTNRTACLSRFCVVEAVANLLLLQRASALDIPAKQPPLCASTSSTCRPFPSSGAHI